MAVVRVARRVCAAGIWVVVSQDWAARGRIGHGSRGLPARCLRSLPVGGRLGGHGPAQPGAAEAVSTDALPAPVLPVVRPAGGRPPRTEDLAEALVALADFVRPPRSRHVLRPTANLPGMVAFGMARGKLAESMGAGVPVDSRPHARGQL